MGSAASRLGTSLLSGLAFAKFKSSKSFKTEAAAAAEAEEEAAAEAAEAAAEEASARRLHAVESAPALGGGGDNGSGGGGSPSAEQAVGEGLQGLPYASLSFGALDGGGPSGGPSGEPSFESPIAGAAAGRSPTLRRQSQTGGAGSSSSGGSVGGIARVADGSPVAGARTAQGRLDFVMQVSLSFPSFFCGQAARAVTAGVAASHLQCRLTHTHRLHSHPLQESTLENQYLAALSAHFAYWQRQAGT